jgi:chaperone modulatory protein CbpM
MTSIEELVRRFPNLRQADIERWTVLEWVRPDTVDGRPHFAEIDVARVRLILELRDDLEVGEDALPVVLSLLDQLFDTRRRMRELTEALAEVAPEEVRRALAARLSGAPEG